MEKSPNIGAKDVTNDTDITRLPHPPRRTAFRRGKEGYHHTIMRADLHLDDELGRCLNLKDVRTGRFSSDEPNISEVLKNNSKNPG